MRLLCVDEYFHLTHVFPMVLDPSPLTPQNLLFTNYGVVCIGMLIGPIIRVEQGALIIDLVSVYGHGTVVI